MLTLSKQSQYEHWKIMLIQGNMHYWHDVMQMAINFVVFIPKTHNPSVILRKTEAPPTTHLIITHQSCKAYQKQKKSKKLSLPRGA